MDILQLYTLLYIFVWDLLYDTNQYLDYIASSFGMTDGLKKIWKEANVA
jgi:hypothetical protein